MDRVLDYESRGWGFKSLVARCKAPVGRRLPQAADRQMRSRGLRLVWLAQRESTSFTPRGPGFDSLTGHCDRSSMAEQRAVNPNMRVQFASVTPGRVAQRRLRLAVNQVTHAEVRVLPRPPCARSSAGQSSSFRSCRPGVRIPPGARTIMVAWHRPTVSESARCAGPRRSRDRTTTGARDAVAVLRACARPARSCGSSLSCDLAGCPSWLGGRLQSVLHGFESRLRLQGPVPSTDRPMAS